MMRHAIDRTPLPKRHGIVTLKLVLAAALLFSVVAMVVDIGLLIARTEALKTLTDSAALAGAAAIAEIPAIGPDVNNPDVPTPNTPEVIASEPLLSIARHAHFVAAQFALANPIAGHRLRLWNRHDGSVTVGWVEHAHLGPDYLFQTQPAGPLNAVEVHARLPVDRVSALTLSLFRIAGRSHLLSTSVAVFDQKLVGFRPVGAANIPLLPLLVSLALSDLGTGTDDNDEGSADVANTDFLLPGSNFVLIVQPGQTAFPSQSSYQPLDPLWGVPLQFGEDGSLNEFVQQVVAGLDFNALADRGGAIVIDGDGDVDVPLQSALAAGQLDDLEAAFSQVIGEPRVLPIGLVQGGTGIGEITGFMAVVVTQVNRTDTQIQLSCSSIRMHTSTALVADAAGRNPWVGKLVLVR